MGDDSETASLYRIPWERESTIAPRYPGGGFLEEDDEDYYDFPTPPQNQTFTRGSPTYTEGMQRGGGDGRTRTGAGYSWKYVTNTPFVFVLLGVFLYVFLGVALFVNNPALLHLFPAYVAVGCLLLGVAVFFFLRRRKQRAKAW